MKLHHLGYACKNIEDALLDVKQLYPVKTVGQIIYDELQNVWLCLVEMEDGSRMELVSGEPVKHFLKEKINLYHLCYEVEHLETAIQHYLQNGAIEAAPPTPAKLFDLRRVCFLQTEAGLIELLEKQQSSPPLSIILGSSFNDVSVKLTLVDIFKKIHIPCVISKAPYGQILQELLNPNSITLKNNGAIFLLIRLEDFINSHKNTLKKQLVFFKTEWIEAINSALKKTTSSLTICFCPPSDHFSQKEKKLLSETEVALIGLSKALPRLYYIASKDLLTHTSTEEYYDAYTDQEGHIPYNPSFERTIALMLARSWHASIRPPYKVISVDCDNTLWQGVCGEDGLQNIRIKEGHLALQRFLLDQRDKGFLICICSKNNLEDVEAVFDHNPDMLLKKSDITAWAVNWLPKSRGLAQLAANLELSLDSFIFIDDNPIECAEVEQNTPEALTLLLPQHSEDFLSFLKATWAFDQLNITQMDKKRAALYAKNNQRNIFKTQFSSLKDFIAQLNLEIDIHPLRAKEIERITELGQRTNQFNTTTVRMTKEEVEALSKQNEIAWTLHAKDRFGNYGLVGFFQLDIEKDSVIVSQFFLSCRVLNKGIEHAILAKIGMLAKKHHRKWVKICFKKNKKNAPAENFLTQLVTATKEETSNKIYFIISAKDAATLTYNPEDENLPTNNTSPSNTSNPSKKIASYEERKSILAVGKEFLEKKTVEKSIVSFKNIDSTLRHLWQEVLRFQTFEPEANFIDLGGNSLLALQLISKIKKHLTIELKIQDIFEHASFNELLLFIEKIMEKTDSYSIASPNQQALWFVDKLEQGAWQYNMPTALILSGPLNIEALKQALEKIIQRHPPLKTIFFEKNGVVYSEALKKYEVPFFVESAKKLSQDDLKKLAKEEAKRKFLLSKELPIRCRLLVLGKDKHLLLLTFHHIAFDGYSYSIFAKELSTFYEHIITGKKTKLAPLSTSYTKYAELQHKLNHKEAISYWKNHLENVPKLAIPTDYERTKHPPYEGYCLPFTLGEELTKRVYTFAKQRKTSIFTICLAAFYTLIRQYSQQNDFAIGIPVSGRCPEDELLIGYFTNILALRFKQEKANFDNLLVYTKKILTRGLEHSNLPFSRLVEQISPTRSLDHSPIFQILFAYQTNDIHQLALPKINLKTYYSGYDAARFELVFELDESSNNLKGHIYYANSLFKKTSIQTLIEGYSHILEMAIQAPETQLDYFSLLSIKQQQTLIQKHENSFDLNNPKLLHEKIEAQVKKNPQALAIQNKNTSLTYKELYERALNLISFLQHKGYPEKTKVGVGTGRSSELIIAILACIKGGFIYVPLDTEYPRERLEFIINDADIRIILTQGEQKKKFLGYSSEIIDLKEIPTNLNPPNKLEKIALTDTAYIFYTSGTTGKPKGVSISQRNITSLFEATKKLYKITREDKILLFHSYAFDVSLWEIFSALCYGASLFIPEKDDILSINHLYTLLEKEKITILNETPSAFYQLAFYESAQNKNNLTHLRLVILAGEALKPQDLAIWFARPQKTAIFNMYGITETTVYSSYALVDQDFIARGKSVIGKAIPGVQLYVLDPYLRPLPPNVTGEIYVGGHGVGLGYINNQKLTDEKFISAPFSDQKLYKTGDRGRWLDNGEIEYRGRHDSQIKLRGYRIELAEIEILLKKHTAVQQVYAALHEGTQLVAHVVSKDSLSKEILQADLLALLQDHLPSYMLPKIQFISDFPLNINGKIDATALTQLSQTFSPKTYQPSTQNNIEKKIRLIWEEVLQKEIHALDINFFDAGGNSLLLMQLHSQLLCAFDEEITLLKLLEYPTIQKFSRYLEKSVVSFRENTPTPSVTQAEAHTIAIVGMAGRFPKADTIEEFWTNIKNGIDCLTSFTPNMNMPQNFVPVSGVISNVDKFDAVFFDYTPEEATLMDPQQRIFLEVAWEALENAGYCSTKFSGNISTFVGLGDNDYIIRSLPNQAPYFNIANLKLRLANEKDYAATKTAYKLGLTGPAVNINTACSTSLVSIVMACQSLANKETDMALAGGISLILPEHMGYLHETSSIFSSDGKNRAFDENSSGTVPSSGVGVVILKRLEDALRDNDTIHAKITGYAINNDGKEKVGFTAPSLKGQIACIQKAHTMAGIEAKDLTYIEAHGTATSLGDSIETQALKSVFEETSNTKQFCALGSVKNNIGHAQSAAGVASLLKSISLVKEKIIPPHIHYHAPRKSLSLEDSPFFISQEAQPITAERIIVGISSFGMGGTNAHIVLENFSHPEEKTTKEEYIVLTLSAKTPEALEKYRKNLLQYLKDSNKKSEPNFLGNLAYTLQFGRTDFKYRQAYLCSDIEEAIKKLTDNTRLSEEKKYTKSALALLCYQYANDWLNYKPVDWSKLYSKPQQRVKAPTYPFIRESYWRPYLKPSVSEPMETGDSTTKILLIDIIKKTLGYQQLVLTDNFQNLGGDSLIAIDILSRIENQFGCKIPFNQFFTAKDLNTAIENTERLIHEHKEESSTILIKMRDGESNFPPLLVLHPGNGSLLSYQDFIDQLDYKGPIIGFQNSIFSKHMHSFENMKSMAAHYITCLKKIFPNGPYTFLGWSFGGTLAFEMATQLEADHDQVLQVALIDTWAAYDTSLYNDAYFYKIYRKDFDGLPKNEQESLLALLRTRLEMLMNYQPKKIKAPIILFKANIVSEEFITLDNPNNHWEDLSYSNVKTILVEGDHRSIMSKQHVPALVKAYESVLKTRDNL